MIYYSRTRRHVNEYEKKKWDKRYYIKNRILILDQQRTYRQKNSAVILERRRQRYIKNRTSTKPYKQHVKGMRIRELEERIEKIKERVIIEFKE